MPYLINVVFCHPNKTTTITVMIENLFSEVEKNERNNGWRLYQQDKDAVKETIAFGRRSEGPPSLYYPNDPDALKLTQPGETKILL